MTAFTRSASVLIDITHDSLDGVRHGHVLVITAGTEAPVDLDAHKAALEAICFPLSQGPLEEICGRTFEDVAQWVLDRMPDVNTVIVALPEFSHRIEARR